MKIPFFKTNSKNPEVVTEEPLEIIDIVAPSSIEAKNSYIKIGERFAKSYFVFSYPRYLSTGWLSPIINLNIPMDISFHLYPVGSEQILKKLRKRVTEVKPK